MVFAFSFAYHHKKYNPNGDKLITELTPDYRVDYLYDENDQLYGFIYNNSEKYFYIRDFMQNILGIMDSNGVLVVKYSYTAYGEITSISGSLASTIGAYNPFRYKGYYYDTETSMYYCKSRYYVPEWCRFISPDSIEYLDPSSINGLNLCVYCGNDPVNYKQEAIFNNKADTPSALVVNKLNGNLFNGAAKVNWGNGGFQIPIWIASLLSGSDFGFSVAPTLRTLYQYARYPGVKDLNKLYGLDYVPGKLNTISSAIGYGLLFMNIGLSAWSNFANDSLTVKQQWISFGVDTAYTLGTFGIGYGVGALVSLIPVAGVFIAPFAAAGATWLIDWSNNKWGWLDNVKQWVNDL